MCFSSFPLTVIALLVAATDALACTCDITGPPCQNAFRVDAVFAGTVTNITQLPTEGPPLPRGTERIGSTLRVDFSVDQAFRGVQGRAVVSVLTTNAQSACGYVFKPGERYLVYAYVSKEGTELRTSICTRTRHISAATEDLEFLQTLSAEKTDARILGTVHHYVTNLSGGDAPEPTPVANVLVTARREGASANVRTDADGRYELPLAPGTYEVAVEVLPRFSSERRSQRVGLTHHRACATVDFSVHFDGRIKGSVRLASGDPADNIPVLAMLAERVGAPGNIETIGTTTAKGGLFELTDLPPGRYVVGVDLIRTIHPEITFPATFHPGTSDPGLATIVELGGGDEIQLDPMSLPPPRRPYRLTGVVVFEDGMPAPRASVVMFDGLARWSQVAVGIQTDADGRFSFVVHEGLSYVVSSHSRDEVQRKQVTGQMGPLVVTGDIGPLKVVLSDK